MCLVETAFQSSDPPPSTLRSQFLIGSFIQIPLTLSQMPATPGASFSQNCDVLAQ